MMCYRDMTFCTFFEDCQNAKSGQCHRPLTEQVQQAAEKWWGGPEAPICRFTEKPSCHIPIEEKPE